MNELTVGEIENHIAEIDSAMKAIVDNLKTLDGETVIVGAGIGDCLPFESNGIPLSKGCVGESIPFDRDVTVSILLNTMYKIQDWLSSIREVVGNIDPDMTLPPSPTNA
jgi:hypothetical protein